MAIKILSNETWRGISLTNCVINLNPAYFIKLHKGNDQWSISAIVQYYAENEYASDPRGDVFFSDNKFYDITELEKNGDLPTIYYSKLKAEFISTEDI
jgi:hypothetical protein